MANEAEGAITTNEIVNVERKEHWNSADSQKRSLANLKPFGPNHRPTNPGRKKIDEVQRLFGAAGRRKVPNDPRNRSMLKLAVETMFVRACKGDVQAAALIFDRLWGRCPRSDELEQMMDAQNITVVVNTNVPRFPQYDFSKLESDLLPESMKSTEK